MNIEVGAVYENGVLKLDQPLPLQEQQRVRVMVQAPGSRVRQTVGLILWSGDPRIIEQVALDPEFGIEEAP